MANLPMECFEAAGPFTHCGVDMFGPFTTILGRKSFKKYVALFLCLSSRTVHMEITNELSTDSLINALRRFITRRGMVRSIRCDNDTNFVGAENEFSLAFLEIDQGKVNDFLSLNNCDWVMWKWNTASASHMGGAWERSIRSVRAILNSVFMDHGRNVNDEVLTTFICEAECIMNSHPLTPESLDDATVNILTPHNLLTMKPKVVLPPPGEFQKADSYATKRWRTVQYFADQFWRRWKREYITNLKRRQKWKKVQRNFKSGDVVLLKQVEVKRNQWPLAVVKRVFPSSDGLVRSM